MSDTQAADLSLMRGLNEQMVLALIREEGPISRAELARRSRLSRSTVSSIVTSLLAENYVYEVGAGDSQGGRRPILLDFNYRESFAVGVDAAANSITMLLTDLQARVLHRVSEPFDLTEGPSVCVPRIVDLFRTMVRNGGVEAARVRIVGIGVPAPLNTSTARLIAPPVMPGWHEVPLRELLEQALGRPVLLENDANLGALAEQRWGAARGLLNAAYIHLGAAGIGGGLILDGKLYRGHIGSAGEIGHITIDEAGPVCRCGSNGCLEAIAGIPALLARAAQLGLAVRTSGELVALAYAGNTIAKQIIAEFGAHLGVAVASLLNLLNPGGVVIGGELAGAGDLLLEPLRATLARRGLAVASERVVLLSGSLGPDVIAMGAAGLAIQQMLNHSVAANISRPAYTIAAGRLSDIVIVP